MFAENLIQLRKINHMSQDELADQIGVSRQTLSKYETGESLPDIERCKRLADVFGVTVDDLINYEKKDSLGLDLCQYFGHKKLNFSPSITYAERIIS